MQSASLCVMSSTKKLAFTAVLTWLLIGHFRVPPSLCFKTRVGAQPLIWKSFFILIQIKLIFTRKVVHLASFWKWGFLELGTGLFLVNPRWRPLLVTSQASSSATSHKIYLIVLIGSKAFHWRQNHFEILHHIKNSGKGFNQFPRTPYTTVRVWICMYVRGLTAVIEPSFKNE